MLVLLLYAFFVTHSLRDTLVLDVMQKHARPPALILTKSQWHARAYETVLDMCL